MTLPDIPEELVEEILCRVPALSLKRLRSTCKQWNHLFTDRKFSRKHFDKAAKQFPALVMMKERTLCSLSVNVQDGIPSAEVTGELSLNQVVIHEVFHCDGLLLCTIIDNSRSIVVWNPCTGQTKWIQTSKSRCYRCQKFVLGNYQDSKSCNKSYKILRYLAYDCDHQEFSIYDINSNSWRNLDVTPPIPYDMCYESCVSLKGKTYWFLWPSDLPNKSFCLISFDYSTERFERLSLPYQCYTENNFLSVVGEEKLSVFYKYRKSSRSEVWVTNKIDDETKEISWSKLFEVEVVPERAMWHGGRFLVDEEKKIVVYCQRDDFSKPEPVVTVSIVGAGSNVTRVTFPVKARPVSLPCLVNYVPSLIQI